MPPSVVDLCGCAVVVGPNLWQLSIVVLLLLGRVAFVLFAFFRHTRKTATTIDVNDEDKMTFCREIRKLLYVGMNSDNLRKK